MKNIWDHYTQSPTNLKAKCNYCSKIFSYAGNSFDKMVDHLLSMHTQAYQQLQDRLTHEFVKFLCLDMVPISGSTNAFRDLFQTICPKWQFPSIDTINSEIHKIFQDIEREVTGLIRHDGFLSIDIFGPNDSYVGFNYHYIDDSWNLRSHTLGIDIMPDCIQFFIVRELYEMIVDKYHIKPHGISIDQGNNTTLDFFTHPIFP